MWQWQGGQPSADGSAPNSASGSSGQPPNSVPPGAPGAPPGAPGQQQELTDMLQMLDQTGGADFEGLNMFNANFE